MYEVRCSDPGDPCERVWRSTGLTPARLLDDPDGRQALVHYGAVPHGGLRYVRPHYPLEEVRVDGLPAEPTYDWTPMDRVLDAMQAEGLAPVFELMGNPSGRFDDFTDPAQQRAWRRLIADLGVHCVERYGRETVADWYFETWNEPDIGFGFEQFGRDSGAFCAYYDACDAGLRDAADRLGADPFVLGGPGTAVTRSELFVDFCEHCADGTNRLTGDPVRLDFVSVHEKGATTDEEDLTPDLEGIVERERAAREHLRGRHPDLAALPFANDECDPQTGWVDSHTWRATPYYAAAVVRSVDLHRPLPGYELLSNDHGFLGDWGQRTLLARFGEGGFEAGGTDPNRASERAHFDSFAFVRKPVYAATTLLSLLGGRWLPVERENENGDVGVLATRRDDGVAVLVYRADDDPRRGDDGRRVRLRLADHGLEDAMRADYRVDRDHGNPFAVWEQRGAPDRPDAGDLAAMRAAAGPGRVGLEPVDGSVEVDVDLPLPGVHLVHLRADPGAAPPAPTDLRGRRARGLDADEAVLAWEGVGRRGVTYETCRDDGDGFEPVGDSDLRTADVRTVGFEEPRFAVRATDYWGRTGPRSEAVRVARE